MTIEDYIRLRAKIIAQELDALQDQLRQEYYVEEDTSLNQLDELLGKAIDACNNIW